jgi:hypothetical protein
MQNMGGSIIIDPPDAGDSSGSGGLPFGCVQYTVELPAEGVVAEPGQICAVEMVPVESNRATRVVFDTGSLPGTGFVEVDPALIDGVVGSPTLEVVDASETGLLDLQIVAVERNGDGFAFELRWPDNVVLQDDATTRLTLRTALEFGCEPQTRVIHSATDVYLCLDEMGSNPEWVSSGDVCTVCRIIAEMAPSPIVPDKVGDDLPLAQALRLRLVELARVSNTLILLAECDGGADLEYEWHASAGHVERLAPDVVRWTLEDGLGAPMIQAAAWGESAAAVATWAFNERAAA